MKEQLTELVEGIAMLPSFPIVLVTVGHNIMTAGAFHFYSFRPPSVMIGIMPKTYTYELIVHDQEFGVNIPTKDQIPLARTCGSVSGRDVDKYARAGVTPFRGDKIGSYLIQECPLNLECRVVHQIAYEGTHRWFIGEVVAFHVDEAYRHDQSLTYWSGQYRGVGVLLEEA